MVWGEVSLTHPTAHARLAIWEMVKGRYKNDFWFGTILSLLGGLLPLLAVLSVVSIVVRHRRRATRVDRPDALRKRLRPGGPERAIGLNQCIRHPC